MAKSADLKFYGFMIPNWINLSVGDSRQAIRRAFKNLGGGKRVCWVAERGKIIYGTADQAHACLRSAR